MRTRCAPQQSRKKRSPRPWAPFNQPLAWLQPRRRSEEPLRTDGGRHALEEGEVAYLVRAKLDPVRQVLAHPGCGHRRRLFGLRVGLPQADRHAGALAGVGESIADEPWLGLEGPEHATLGGIDDLGEGAIGDLVVGEA